MVEKVEVRSELFSIMFPLSFKAALKVSRKNSGTSFITSFTRFFLERESMNFTLHSPSGSIVESTSFIKPFISGFILFW